MTCRKFAFLADIYQSYNDCFAATAGTSLAPAALEKLGWTRAEIKSDGKKVEGGPIIYGHAERQPIILLSATQGKGICVVNARIKDFSVFEEFKKSLGGKLPKPDDTGEITFIAEGRPVQIAPSGSRSKPALRLVVMTPLESK